MSTSDINESIEALNKYLGEIQSLIDFCQISGFKDENEKIKHLLGTKPLSKKVHTDLKEIMTNIMQYEENKATNSQNSNVIKNYKDYLQQTIEKMKEQTKFAVGFLKALSMPKQEGNKEVKWSQKPEDTLITTFKNIDNCISNIIQLYENIEVVADLSLRDQYERKKNVYVIMFANSEYKDENDEEIMPPLCLRSDIEAAKKVFTKDKGFELRIHENLKKKETDDEITKLTNFNFENYSSILVICDSHGGTDGELCTSDGLCVNVADFYEAFKKNHNLSINTPVIIIVDACRGKDEDFQNTKKTKIVNRFHPDRHNSLVVFATNDSYIALGDVIGSLFLPAVFEIIDQYPEWDILAQITRATERVLEKYQPAKNNERCNQTASFISLLPSQFRFSGESIHKWNDVPEYESGKVVVFFDKELPLDATEKNEIEKAINEAGFIIVETEEECKKADIGTLIIIASGFGSDFDIHETLLPNLQKKYSYKSTPELHGRPKAFLFLGKKELDFDTNPDTSSSRAVKSRVHSPVASSNTTVTATLNSDYLAYCDSANGWCEAICTVIRKSGNSEGLVYLLTEAMRRPNVLEMANPSLPLAPPHIQSSLRRKLVMSKNIMST